MAISPRVPKGADLPLVASLIAAGLLGCGGGASITPVPPIDASPTPRDTPATPPTGPAFVLYTSRHTLVVPIATGAPPSDHARLECAGPGKAPRGDEPELCGDCQRLSPEAETWLLWRGRLVRDSVWLTDDPPPDVKALFATEYPTMGRVPDVLARLAHHGFNVVEHFTLPDVAWWDDFYAPMQRRIEALRARYVGDPEAQAALDGLAEEPAHHPAHAAHFAYEFFVARRDV